MTWRPRGADGSSFLLALLCVACSPDVRDPLVFADEIERVRGDWLDVCEKECAKQESPTACEPPPGDPVSCGLFDPTKANECYIAYEIAYVKRACAKEDRSVYSIHQACGAVYSDCAMDSTDTTGTGGP